MAWPHAGFPCSSNPLGYFSSFLQDVDTELCCQDRSPIGFHCQAFQSCTSFVMILYVCSSWLNEVCFEVEHIRTCACIYIYLYL